MTIKYDFVCTTGRATVITPRSYETAIALSDYIESYSPGIRACLNTYNTRLKTLGNNCVPVNTQLFLFGPAECIAEFINNHQSWLMPNTGIEFTPRYGQSNIKSIEQFEDLMRHPERFEVIADEIISPITRLLKPGFNLHPYQKQLIGCSHVSNSAYMTIPAGGGKTRTALIAAFARIYSHATEFNNPIANYSVLIVGPDICENSWCIQPAELTPEVHHLKYFRNKKSMRTYSFKPVTERNKSDPTYAKYKAFCREQNIPQVAFCNSESLPKLLAEIQAGDCIPIPSVLIYDEIHTMSSRDRYAIKYDALGKPIIESAKTEKANQSTRASVLSALSKTEGILLYIGLTGTPFGDGSHRKYWAQIDLINPYYFGSYFNYRQKFTAAAPNAFKPEVDDSASINHIELRNRLSRFLIQIPQSVVDQYMPVIRYQTEWVNYDSKNPIKIKLDATSAEDEINTSPRELRLAQACQVKAPAVAETVAALLAINPTAKVIIFVGRRKQTALFAEELRKKLFHKWRGDNKPSWDQPELVCRNGDNSSLERTEAIQYFAEPGQQRVLIATYQFMGMSLDGLQCATNCEVAMIPSSPDIWSQLRGRIKRLGGVPCLFRMWFARNTYDERVYSSFAAAAAETHLTLDVIGEEINTIAELMADPELATRILVDSNINWSAWGVADDPDDTDEDE